MNATNRGNSTSVLYPFRVALAKHCQLQWQLFASGGMLLSPCIIRARSYSCSTLTSHKSKIRMRHTVLCNSRSSTMTAYYCADSRRPALLLLMAPAGALVAVRRAIGTIAVSGSTRTLPVLVLVLPVVLLAASDGARDTRRAEDASGGSLTT